MSTRTLFIIAVLLLVVIVGATGVLFYSVRHKGIDANSEVPDMAEHERIIYVFFPTEDPAGEELSLEARVVPADLKRFGLAEEIVRQLIMGPTKQAPAIFPAGTELKALFIDGEGVVYMDLDRAAFREPADATGELMFMRALLESLRRNLEDISGIKILVDSEETDTLWGHVDGLRVWDGRGR